MGPQINVADADAVGESWGTRRRRCPLTGSRCLGQTLARAELEIALPVLLRRLPNLRLAVPLEQLRSATT